MVLTIDFISPRRVTIVLLVICLLLILLSTVGQVAHLVFGHDHLKGFVPLFDIDQEANIPAWFSSCIILFAAGILGIIAFAKKRMNDRFSRYWVALAVIFLLLSIDEASMIHEYSVNPLREFLNAGGLFYYTWVIPGLAFVTIVGLLYFRFLLSLNTRFKVLFILAGAVYIGGCLGIEMISAYHASLHGEDNLTYMLIATVEELFEMVGIIIFIYALLEYLILTAREIRVRFVPSA